MNDDDNLKNDGTMADVGDMEMNAMDSADGVEENMDEEAGEMTDDDSDDMEVDE